MIATNDCEPFPTAAEARELASKWEEREIKREIEDECKAIDEALRKTNKCLVTHSDRLHASTVAKLRERGYAVYSKQNTVYPRTFIACDTSAIDIEHMAPPLLWEKPGDIGQYRGNCEHDQK